MSDPAKKVLDLQRRVQQAFLGIKENCNPLTFISRRKTGNVVEFQLKCTIEKLVEEVGEIKAAKIGEGQADMFLTEVNLLEQSTERLQAIYNLMIATNALKQLNGDDALMLIRKSEADFNEMREKYPFTKKDVEADIAHVVYALFKGVSVEKDPPNEPKVSDIAAPMKREFTPASKCSQQCFDLLKKVRIAIDEPTTTLHLEGSLEIQEVFSTEKYVSDIKKSVKPCDWLPALKMERCKISDRASKVLQCLKELIRLAAANQTELEVARTVGAILQLYTIRAPPTQYCGTDAVVYFNDCLYLTVEMERAKFEVIYKLEAPTDAFNFSDLLSRMRLNARSVLIRDLDHIKTQFLTWPQNAFTAYLNREGNSFAPALSQLKRLASLWKDVCSKSVYAWIMVIICSHLLNLLVDSLNNLPDFKRATCVKSFIPVNEIVDACSGYIRASEQIMNKKFVELKHGQDLQQKVDELKKTMAKQGADRSLTELFDFKVVL